MNLPENTTASGTLQGQWRGDGAKPELYKDRFENLFRVAKEITSCLNIGDVLETIRDEVKTTVPHALEACMILVDPEAPKYSRPLHCAKEKSHVNCRLCKRESGIIQRVLQEPTAFYCTFEDGRSAQVISDFGRRRICELALSIHDGDQPLAVLAVLAEEGRFLDERDIVLLTDLAELATNTIINARQYSKMAREKLSLERILHHIRPFVPETVQRIVEKNPDAPELTKTEIDVSILFLDVADYTRISEGFAQDKVNFIIEKYFSSFLDIIYAHVGDMNETAGDGLMAIFIGEEHENALNATSAAMKIRRRTAEINEDLKGLFYPIVINMGVNSGKASVGMSRFVGETGTRMTFTASGPTTNLAARLAAEAKDGDILIGPETARRIQQQIMLFDRGAMNLKNIRQTVHVFSLVPPP